MRTEREERKIDADLRRSQRSCEQLDNQKVGSLERSVKSSVLHIVMLKIKVYGNAKESLHPTAEVSFCVRGSPCPERPGTGPKSQLTMMTTLLKKRTKKKKKKSWN